MKLLLLGILVLLLLLSVCLFAMVQYRKNLDKQMNHILEILDRALDGQKTLAVFDESADAAISERINRLLDISNASYRKADEERNVVKSLIADISHQVRTPLTNIMLYTGLLAEAEIDDQSRALTQKIQAQTEKLDFFMKELVHSSYLESDMLALHPAFSGTAELLGLVCQAEELQAMKKHISFQISGEDFQAFFDMKWTAEALGNILNNAVKYAPKGSEIQLFAESYDSFIRIHVRDQGPGISEKEQGMIFSGFTAPLLCLKKKVWESGCILPGKFWRRRAGISKWILPQAKAATSRCFFPDMLFRIPYTFEICQNCHF